ncbi:hypothetical protein CYLTODRAFT_416592 [Cylindrobasidium torrendii FP15055 ss-10]|uniref:Uncharacterized protein n=1 Tax=Cylindrobasidium torrendii FP15055 ss-10 TaxID=1314674 RepID=A0A0D7BU45_9AGAR|nr:hypothetical protein CYLTODRAFT_416592 [Cylindrobasidium torrendii FP15055 ss-10]
MFLEKGGPNVPVLVFTFVASNGGEGRSLFLKVRESFEEMRTVLENKVPPHASCPRMKLNLFISNLGVCDGREVEVDEDAWTTLVADGKGVISEVLVRVSREDAGKGKQAEDEKENRRPLSVWPLDEPKRKSNSEFPQSPARSTSSSPAPHRSSPTPKKARSAEPAAANLFASDDHVAQSYEDTEDDEESPPRREYDETDEEENRMPSQSSQGSGRSWEQVHHQVTSGADEETDDDVFKSTKPPKAPAPIPVISRKDVPKPSPKPSPKKRSSLLADDLDTSYKVTVVGPGSNQRASLAAKGKYQVKKVLNAVCKKFSLTGSDSASLYIRNDPDDLEVLCLPEQTMAEVGAREGSELIVNLHDESDDEDEEDEDSE